MPRKKATPPNSKMTISEELAKELVTHIPKILVHLTVTQFRSLPPLRATDALKKLLQQLR